MDRFYLENVALYGNLVKSFRPSACKETNVTNTPAMVVSARIRPLSEEDQKTGFPRAAFPRKSKSDTVDIHDLYNHPRGRPVLKSFNYSVDQLFDSTATTDEIYDSLVSGLIPFARNGGISTLFSYGQTGSGKTFTVSRLQQLAAAVLMDDSSSSGTRISLSIVDLAGNSAFDLLNSRKPVSVLEDSMGNTQLAGTIEHPVSSKEEMIGLINRAASFRKTQPTQKNDVSSRSHGICRIRIVDVVSQSEGLIYFVDLAGSEIARDSTFHSAERMRETREINMSLSVLKDCIRGKAEFDSSTSRTRRKPHIPFRQSALTRVLKHVFDPTEHRPCRNIVIACLSPSLADVAATKNTLRYAEMLRVLVAVEPTKPPKVPPFPDCIVPGMTIRWRESSDERTMKDVLNLATVLCPAHATQSSGEPLSDSPTGRFGSATRYLCALFFQSAAIEGVYELDLSLQKLIDVGMMEGEVKLEYDRSDRVYRIKG